MGPGRNALLNVMTTRHISQDYELISGLFSIAGSASVILTCLIFPELRKLRYIELVFYISSNDILASIGISLGAQNNGTAACWYQGLSTNVNYLSAIFWSTVISYQVWLVVFKSTILKDLTYFHIVCWLLPLLVALLPLTTNTYGNLDDSSEWCFIAERSDSPSWGQLFWVIVAFYGWFWLALLINGYIIITIVLRIRNMEVVPPMVLTSLHKLLLYPLILSVCWALATASDFYAIFGGEYNPTSYAWGVVVKSGTIIAVSQGFIFACIFFRMNPLVRYYWKDLFWRIGLALQGKSTPDGRTISIFGSRSTISLTPQDLTANHETFNRKAILSVNRKTLAKCGIAKDDLSLSHDDGDDSHKRDISDNDDDGDVGFNKRPESIVPSTHSTITTSNGSRSVSAEVQANVNHNDNGVNDDDDDTVVMRVSNEMRSRFSVAQEEDYRIDQLRPKSLRICNEEDYIYDYEDDDQSDDGSREGTFSERLSSIWSVFSGSDFTHSTRDSATTTIQSNRDKSSCSSVLVEEGQATTTNIANSNHAAHLANASRSSTGGELLHSQNSNTSNRSSNINYYRDTIGSRDSNSLLSVGSNTFRPPYPPNQHNHSTGHPRLVSSSSTNNNANNNVLRLSFNRRSRNSSSIAEINSSESQETSNTNITGVELSNFSTTTTAATSSSATPYLHYQYEYNNEEEGVCGADSRISVNNPMIKQQKQQPHPGDTTTSSTDNNSSTRSVKFDASISSSRSDTRSEGHFDE